MQRSTAVLCWILGLAAMTGAVAGSVERQAAIWDDPARDEWQKPLTLLEFLGIERGATVADVGAGTGYLTKLLSIQVGPEGRVYAVDVKKAFLDHLMAREDVMTDRVVPLRAKKNDPLLPAGEIDLVIVLNTWHHIDDRTQYLSRLLEALSPEGRVAIVDYREGELPVGPRPSIKLPREQVVSEFKEAGWRFVAESVALPYQYVLVFLPPEKPDTRGFLNR
jgi:predicted methyltransferase